MGEFQFQSVNKLLEKSFRENWDKQALSNYQGISLCYRDVARRIEKLHIAFEKCFLHKGDKVAICARNQVNWAVSYLATITYGAVVVRSCTSSSRGISITLSTTRKPRSSSWTTWCGRDSVLTRCRAFTP